MNLGLALLGGALLAASMPGPDQGWLAWIALIPLLWAIDGKSPREALRIGWLGGAAFFALDLYWLFSLWDWGSFAVIPGYLMLVAYLGLYWGIFAALYAFSRSRLPLWAHVVTAPALWAALEYARSLTRFGFTWGQLSDALYQQLPFIQLASLTGPWGVSFVVALVNLLLFLGMRRRTRGWAYLAAAVALMALVFGWGSARLNRPVAPGPELSVSIVQPNIPQEIRSDAARLDEFTAIYERLLGRVAGAPGESDLVILPESILPAFVLSDADVLRVFADWARTHGSPLIFGTYSRRDREYYNTTALIQPDGKLVDSYDKVQLVPFSTEYFPGIRLLKRLGISRWLEIGDRLGQLSPGREWDPLQSGPKLGPVATPICFESIFPQISRTFVRNGARLIVTLTNDAWFHGTWALPQHFAKGVFRAVENGRFFVQAANTGISGIIDPRGRILVTSRIQQEAVPTGTVRLLQRRTVYTRYGDWFAYFSLLYLGIALGLMPAVPALMAARSQRGSRPGPRRW